MVLFETDHLIFRDMIEEDIENRIRWETVETEWQFWDGPWEYEGKSDEEKEADLKEYVEYLHAHIAAVSKKQKKDIRFSFQVVEKESGRYIGWVNSYNIDENYVYTDGEGFHTIGLDLPDLDIRGKGYGTEALEAVIQYFLSNGYVDIYTQTWSGNERMVHLAEKLHFKEICRKKDYRTVRGRKFDGLTFLLQNDLNVPFAK